MSGAATLGAPTVRPLLAPPRPGVPTREPNSSRVLDVIRYANDIRGFHDQAVAQVVECLEHHEGAGSLVGQPNLMGSQPGHSIQKALVRGVANDASLLEHSQHIARREAAAGAAVDHHHFVLTG